MHTVPSCISEWLPLPFAHRRYTKTVGLLGLYYTCLVCCPYYSTPILYPHGVAANDQEEGQEPQYEATRNSK
jgi:hypothetical protein